MVFQADGNECALACWAMILAYHRQPVSLAELRARFMSKSGVMSIRELLEVAKTLSFAPRALRCEVQEIDHLELPAILHWGFDHYVVLKKVRRGSVIVHDPAIGIRQLSKSEFANHFTGVALELAPGETVADLTPTIAPRKFNYVGATEHVIPALVQVLILSCLLQMFTLITALYMQLIVDEVLIKHNVDLLTVLAAGFLGLAVITLVTRCLQEATGLFLSQKLSIQMASRLYCRLIHLKTSFFQSRHMGDIVSRFQSLAAIQDFVTNSVISMLLNVVLVVTTLGMMFFYSTWLGALVFFAASLLALGKLAFYWPLRHRMQEKIVSEATLESHFMESVRNISALQRFNAEATNENEYANKLVNLSNAAIRLGYTQLANNLYSSGLRSVLYIVVVYLLAREVLAEAFTIGMLYAFLAYFDRMINAAESLTSEVLKAMMLKLHLERLSDITQTDTNKTPVSLPRSLTTPKHVLKMTHGSFSYKGLPIFADCNVTLSPGEHLSIIGPSGSGKTTFLKVCQGLITLDDGEIQINDRLVTDDTRKILSSNIASVMQEDSIIAGSIIDNITFRDPFPDMENVVACAKLVLFHEDILRHPLAYDRKVYEMDQSLSAGQCQKILLARALYRKPDILFLDEGTAHLDERTAFTIMQRILATDVTCIYSTHLTELVPLSKYVLQTESSRFLVSGNTSAIQTAVNAKPINR